MSGHLLDYHYVDDECNDLHGPGKIAALYHRHKYSAFIGPSCSNVCGCINFLSKTIEGQNK